MRVGRTVVPLGTPLRLLAVSTLESNGSAFDESRAILCLRIPKGLKKIHYAKDEDNSTTRQASCRKKRRLNIVCNIFSIYIRRTLLLMATQLEEYHWSLYSFVIESMAAIACGLQFREET